MKNQPHPYRWKMDAVNCADCGKTRADEIHEESKWWQTHPFEPNPSNPLQCRTCAGYSGGIRHSEPEVEHPFEPFFAYAHKSTCRVCGEKAAHSVHNGRALVTGPDPTGVRGAHPFSRDWRSTNPFICATCGLTTSHSSHLYYEEAKKAHAATASQETGPLSLAEVSAKLRENESAMAERAGMKLGSVSVQATLDALKEEMGVVDATVAQASGEAAATLPESDQALAFLPDGKGGVRIEKWTPEFQARVTKAIADQPEAADPLKLIEECKQAEEQRVISETEAAEAAYGYADLKCEVIGPEAAADFIVREREEADEAKRAGATEGFEKVVQRQVLEAFDLHPGDVGLPGPTSMEVRVKARREARIADLKEWWAATSAEQIEMVAEKAVTYGSNSLEQLGRKMAQLRGQRVTTAEEAQELGCWVYLTGKVERWTDAVMRGERPKMDTLVDIVAYAMMAQRIRDAGGWPDGQED